MLTHVALLRGINVGGRNRVAMADLRALVTSLGHGEVATYIQSGNVVFASGREVDTAALAQELEEAIAQQVGVRPGVVVLTRGQLRQVVDGNPFPDERNPKALHALFRADAFPPDEVAAIHAALQQARERGSDEEAQIAGRTLYLRTPSGLGASELATRMARPTARTTARNWATVTKLMDLLDATDHPRGGGPAGADGRGR